MRYFKFPKWLKGVYPGAIWDFYLDQTIKPKQNTLYLTFDDGPNPKTTVWILNCLKKYNAKATFFCLGKNAENHPELLQRISNEGHAIGNHTYNHLNGFFTDNDTYVADVLRAKPFVSSDLFRPPYGKLKRAQHKLLQKEGFQTVFWSHISYDFDASFSTDQRMKRAMDATQPGAIFVFHDSDKAFPQLKHELPKLLKYWDSLGFGFNVVPQHDDVVVPLKK